MVSMISKSKEREIKLRSLLKFSKDNPKSCITCCVFRTVFLGGTVVLSCDDMRTQ